MVKNHFEFVAGKRRKKFFVILNRDCAESRVYFFIVTSKVDKFLRLPWGASEGVAMPANSIPALTKDSIIDCHSLYPPLDRARLFDDYWDQESDIVGTLPPDRLTAVDAIIVRSRVIPLDIKRRILSAAI